MSDTTSPFHLSIFDEKEFANPVELGTAAGMDFANVRKLCASGAIKAVDVRSPGAKRPRWKISWIAWENFCRMRSGLSPVGHRKRRTNNKPADLSEFFGDEFSEGVQ